MFNIYNIIEVANTHGGSLDYVNSLIDEYSVVSDNNMGIKFQPLSAEGLSHSDFEYYAIYQELEFTEPEWCKIISKASDYFDIWLDMFDVYSVTVLNDNLDKIKGIKLQSSTLKNYQLRSALRSVNINDKILIINIAGYEIETIKSVVSELKNDLNPKEIVLQLGFQDYPTSIEDCGLHKIEPLRTVFDGELCFADHTDGQSDDAILLPMLALAKGCLYIEKHIMHSSIETKYDAASSVYLTTYKKILDHQNDYVSIYQSPFLVEKEKEYLNKTYQMPMAKSLLKAGQTLNIYTDLDYKRTAQLGLTVIELEEIIKSGAVLNRNIEKGNVLKRQYFE